MVPVEGKQNITLENRRILVIEDNLDVQEDYRKLLAATPDSTDLDQAGASLFDEAPVAAHRESLELSFADQGQVGFHLVEAAIANNKPYALAFVDMRMPPGWDGLVTIEHIWKADPHIQVVICTAFTDHPWDEITARVGRTDQLLILRKPFDGIEVEQLAASLTRKWELARRAQLRMDGITALVDIRYKELKESNARLEMEVVSHTAAYHRLNKQFEQFVKDVHRVNTESRVDGKSGPAETLEAANSGTEHMKALSGNTSVAVVDSTVLAELRQLDEGGELLHTLITHFLQDTPKHLATLQIALSQGDALGLTEAAHTLKGSSSNLGATRIQRLCSELQTLGRAGKLDHVGDRLATLGAEFAAVQTILLKVQEEDTRL